MFRFFGAVPRLLVPDNLKSGVNKASFYDPEVNRTYAAMATHYSVGVLPARPRKPKDKAAVEAGVRFAQYYILGRSRHRTDLTRESNPGRRIPESRGGSRGGRQNYDGREIRHIRNRAVGQ
jgi:transposase